MNKKESFAWYGPAAVTTACNMDVERLKSGWKHGPLVNKPMFAYREYIRRVSFWTGLRLKLITWLQKPDNKNFEKDMIKDTGQMLANFGYSPVEIMEVLNIMVDEMGDAALDGHTPGERVEIEMDMEGLNWFSAEDLFGKGQWNE